MRGSKIKPAARAQYKLCPVFKTKLMGETNQSADNHKRSVGVKKSKKLSTRVDLTPMVDLGFLLITFFIFTTTMSEPNSMKLQLPKDVKSQNDLMDIKESSVITIIPAKDNQIYYYEGKLQVNGSNVKTTDFSSIRDIIIQKKKTSDPKFFFVVLKPTTGATYGNTVDLLDEFIINDVNHYALTDLSEEENQLVSSFIQSN
ncbi:MAG: ExbD/TolR family protein [Flavitalea sp.]